MQFTPSDTLFHLAIVLVIGIIGGEVVGRLKLPKVTGWIFATEETGARMK